MGYDLQQKIRHNVSGAVPVPQATAMVSPPWPRPSIPLCYPALVPLDSPHFNYLEPRVLGKVEALAHGSHCVAAVGVPRNILVSALSE
jgi:hypothetical protein